MNKSDLILQKLEKIEMWMEKIEKNLHNIPVSKIKAPEKRINNPDDGDPLFKKALEIVQLTKIASASVFQRKLNIGYARSARILDELEQAGYIGPADGSKPRKILKV